MKNCVIKFYNNNRDIILALVYTIIGFFVVKVFSIVRFLTNDDTGIQTVYAYGYTYQQFVNYWLGCFICLLYKISSSISWWYWWSIICQLFGTFLINYAIIKIKKDRIMASFMVIVFYLCFGAFYMSLIAFTIVPCIIATGGISLLFLHKNEQLDIKHLIIPIGTMLLATMHRYETGMEMMFFFLVGIIYYVYSTQLISVGEEKALLKKRMMMIFGIFSISLFLCGVVLVSSRAIKMEQESENFYDFTNYRSVFADFPKDTYEQNVVAYNNVNWDQNIYELAIRGCYMPAEVNLESLKELSRTVSNNSNIISTIISTIESIHIKSLRQYVRSIQNYDGFTRLVTSVYIFFIGIVLIIIRIKNGKWNVGQWCAVLTLLGTSGLILVLWLMGRNILRAYLIVVIPMTVISFLLSNDLEIDVKDNALIYIIVCIITISSVNLYSYSLLKSRGEFDDKYVEVIKYVQDNTDKLFYFSDTSILGLGGDTVIPENLKFWGGTDWNSKYNSRIFEKFGIAQLTFETALNDNVLYLTKTDDLTLNQFETYYLNHGMVVKYELVDNVGGYSVYKARSIR